MAAPSIVQLLGHIPIAVHKLWHAGSDTSHFDLSPRAQSFSCWTRSRESFKTASPPRLGFVGITVRWQYFAGRPQDHSGCDLRAPNVQSIAPSCCLLFICGSRVIVKVMTVLPFP